MAESNQAISVEATSRTWKALIVLSWCLLVLGALLWVTGGIMVQSGGGMGTMIVGRWLIVFAVASWLIGKAGAWWSHR